jgi:hypothetical protein
MPLTVGGWWYGLNRPKFFPDGAEAEVWDASGYLRAMKRERRKLRRERQKPTCSAQNMGSTEPMRPWLPVEQLNDRSPSFPSAA